MAGKSIGGVGAGQPRKRKATLLDPRAMVFKAERFTRSDIEFIAAGLEPRLAKAIFAALTAQAESLDLDAIAEALQAGDIGRVLAMLDLSGSVTALEGATPVLQSAVYAGGVAAATAINARVTGAQFVFNQLNPRLLTWLQTYNLGLIRQINQGTKDGIRQYLLTGMEDGKNPKAVAKEIKGIVGLTERQAQAVKNYRKELETFHLRRSAAGYGLGNKVDRVNGTQVLRTGPDGQPLDGINERRLRDYRFDGQLNRAMTNTKPLTPEQIDKMVAAYERKYRAYRARTIARTEAIRTTNIGVQDGWQQAIEKGTINENLTRKRWIVASDERLCETCGPIPSMNPKTGVKHGQAFQTPKGPQNLPPMHPNCRCTVFYRLYEPSQLKGEN